MWTVPDPAIATFGAFLCWEGLLRFTYFYEAKRKKQRLLGATSDRSGKNLQKAA